MQDEILHAEMPKFNNALVFHGNMVHVARPPRIVSAEDCPQSNQGEEGGRQLSLLLPSIGNPSVCVTVSPAQLVALCALEAANLDDQASLDPFPRLARFTSSWRQGGGQASPPSL